MLRYIRIHGDIRIRPINSAVIVGIKPTNSAVIVGIKNMRRKITCNNKINKYKLCKNFLLPYTSALSVL